MGSLREDIVKGKTGMICRAEDPDDLADKVRRYFDSDLFRNITENRRGIIIYGNESHSWEEVGDRTLSVYGKLCEGK